MGFRRSQIEDLDRIVRIVEDAKAFLRSNSVSQWQRGAYPDRELFASDVANGIGLAWGVDFNALPNPGVSKVVARDCFDHGLIAERAGRGDNVIKIMPPLVITDEEMARGSRFSRRRSPARNRFSKRGSSRGRTNREINELNR